MNKLPIWLIYTRLLLGFVMVGFSLMHVSNYATIFIILLTVGLLTDIFDGIIARKLNVSTQSLRRLDSTIDQVFFLSATFSAYIHCTSFFTNNTGLLLTVIGFEALTYLVCFIKFRKEIAIHSIGAKIWTLILFATLLQIVVQC